MEKLKFALLSIVTLALLGIFGYWSITTIQSGTEYATDQKIKELEKENGDLETEVKRLTSEIGVLESKLEEFTPKATENPETTETTVYKHQVLIDELQTMIDKKVFLKAKSRGPSVGTVQKFLSVYNDISLKIDSVYGPGTVGRVIDFQKDLGLTADGEAGTSTFSKMIEWLKKS